MAPSRKKTSPKPDARYSAPALEKGLQIIELLAADADGLTQKQIAQCLGRSPNEVYRMIACLEAAGYVRRTRPADTYHLTTRLFELAHQHPPTERLLDAALPVMRALSKNIRQSCHLAIRRETDVIVIAQIDGPEYYGFAVRLGSRIPLLESTSGLVLLAFERPDLLAELLQQFPHPPKELATLRHRLTRIRTQGHEQHESRTIQGVVDLGLPIIDHTHRPAAVLTVPYVLSRSTAPAWPTLRATITTASQQISTAVGGRVANPV